MATDTLHDAAAMQPLLGRALDHHAALLHLLRDWDINAPPHDLHAQFTAIEACARITETALYEAIEHAGDTVRRADAVPAATLTAIDFECQNMAEEVETLCRAVAARQAVTDERSALDVSRLLAMIEDRAFTTMNRVNSQAEDFGCNHKS